MAYLMNTDDVINFAGHIKAETRIKGDELFFKECPYCGSGHNKHDKWTSSVNLITGAFHCFRSSCQKGNAHFVQLARDFGYKLDFGQQERQYKELRQAEIVTRPRAVEYLESRGIDRQTVERYNITTRRDNQNILVFPFRDESGRLVCAKYRNTKFNGQGNKEWFEKDTKPILFGMAQCDTSCKTLVLTEGQIDSLSLSTAGIKNAVSVPNGAKGFTWLAHCWDWINQFEEIIVFGDYENGKMTLIEEVTKRLPKKTVKMVNPEFYAGCKDANEILQKFGKEFLVEAVNSAMFLPMDNVKDLADVESIDIYNLPKVKTNLPELDNVIGGLYFGQVVLLTGRRGEGKSTFASQIMAEALEQELTVFAYSGELTDYHFKRWIDLQIAGRNHIKQVIAADGSIYYTIPDDVQEKINTWYRGRAWIYDNNYLDDDKNELETLLETVENAIIRKGVKLILIDNLMTALFCNSNDELYNTQGRFVRKLKKLAVKYDVAVLLVAHPRKESNGAAKRNGQIYNDDVAGSADITNAVDTVLAYSRNPSPSVETGDSLLSVIKNRLTGKRCLDNDAIQLYYSNSSKRITSEGSNLDYEYSWNVEYRQEDLPF